MSRNAYPLSWPEGWKREKFRKRAAFNRFGQQLSVMDAIQRALRELSLMGISRDDVIISTDIPVRLDGLPRSDRAEPSDPGVAIYWQKKGKPMRTMAIDKYDRVADNLAAIAATLEAMRAIERHGGATILDRAFTGFAALPEKASQNWRQVLGVPSGQVVTLDYIEQRFRNLVQVHHPDKGGDREKFEAIVAARDAAKLEVA